jgi:hypothetical protein
MPPQEFQQGQLFDLGLRALVALKKALRVRASQTALHRKTLAVERFQQSLQFLHQQPMVVTELELRLI